jgi:hypothetical protein
LGSALSNPDAVVLIVMEVNVVHSFARKIEVEHKAFVLGEKESLLIV